MAINKKASFQEPEVMLAEFAKALGHPARVGAFKSIGTAANLHLRRNSRGVATGPKYGIAAPQGVVKCRTHQWHSGQPQVLLCINWENFSRFESASRAFFDKANEQRCC